MVDIDKDFYYQKYLEQMHRADAWNSFAINIYRAIEAKDNDRIKECLVRFKQIRKMYPFQDW